MQLNYPMKSNGMFLIKKPQFDVLAEEILIEYQPSTLHFPKRTDIEYMVMEQFGLDIKHEMIRQDGKILGMIAFEDTDFEIEGYEQADRMIHLDEGTILIDMSLIGNENYRRKRFTLAHELSHWILHRSYYSPTHQKYDFRKNNGVIACRSENIEQYNKGNFSERSEADWIEWQADCLAAALLMPKTTFQDEVRSALRNAGITSNYLCPRWDDKWVAKKIIAGIADVFDASQRAVQIRMVNLGFIRQ